MTTRVMDTTKPQPNTNDHHYLAYIARVEDRLHAQIKAHGPLFTTDVDNLFEVFLNALPHEQRGFHACHACRRFYNTFGTLVVLDETGSPQSALWEMADAPDMYKLATAAMQTAVRRATVTGVFASSDTTWGTPQTGLWYHMAVKPPSSAVWKSRTKSAFEAMAEKKEDYGMVGRALGEYDAQIAATALTVIESGTLLRPERVQPVAKWFNDLHTARANAQGKLKNNVLWRAVATAPQGFAHVKTSMIGTLLEDLKAGFSFEQVKTRFATLMDPARYQHATVAPKAGQIETAEKLFDKLGLAPALARRYATLGDIPQDTILWRPAGVTGKTERLENAPGVFSHLQPRNAAPPAAPTVVPGATMTWEKFQKVVLPTASAIEVQIPTSANRFVALVTATDEDAPPILQWDNTETRNPVSWYYAGGTIDAEIRRRVTQAGGKVHDVDIGFRLIWNSRHDVDAHAAGPNNDYIYYHAKRGRTYKGWLDVDMNVHAETETPVENIRWDKGQAPNGQYQFYVNLFSAHGRYGSMVPFTAEIEIDGAVYTVHGQTRVENSGNQRNRMVQVANFTYQRGQPVQFHAIDATVRQAEVSPTTWGLAAGSYVPVTAIVPSPNLWGAVPLEQHGKHAFLLLQGCQDTQEGVGRGFLTEMTRGDLHPVRSVLEAYVGTASIAGAETASACGIGISSTNTANTVLRVTRADGTRAQYVIDRWD